MHSADKVNGNTRVAPVQIPKGILSLKGRLEVELLAHLFNDWVLCIAEIYYGSFLC